LTQGFTVGSWEGINHRSGGSCIGAISVVDASFEEDVVYFEVFSDIVDVVELLTLLVGVGGGVLIKPEVLLKGVRLGEVGFGLQVELGGCTGVFFLVEGLESLVG